MLSLSNQQRTIGAEFHEKEVRAVEIDASGAAIRSPSSRVKVNGIGKEPGDEDIAGATQYQCGAEVVVVAADAVGKDEIARGIELGNEDVGEERPEVEGCAAGVEVGVVAEASGG